MSISSETEIPNGSNYLSQYPNYSFSQNAYLSVFIGLYSHENSGNSDDSLYSPT